MGDQKKYIYSIDLMRIIACFAVVVSHWLDRNGVPRDTTPFQPYYWLGHLAHFAVPFFFLLSGYLIRRSIESGRPPILVANRHASKILPVYLFWVIMNHILVLASVQKIAQGGFSLIAQDFHTLLNSMAGDPLRLLLTGHVDHLWFLTSLIWGAYWISGSALKPREKWFFVVGSITYLTYILTCTYRNVFGIAELPVTLLQVILSPIVFMSWGYEIRRRKICPNVSISVLMIFAGYLLQYLERYILAEWFHDPGRQRYMLGVCLMSSGALFLALNKPDFGKHPLISKIAGLTLGIYVLHVWIGIKLRQYHITGDGHLWFIAGPLMIWALTAAIVWLFSKLPHMRRFFVVDYSQKK